MTDAELVDDIAAASRTAGLQDLAMAVLLLTGLFPAGDGAFRLVVVLVLGLLMAASGIASLRRPVPVPGELTREALERMARLARSAWRTSTILLCLIVALTVPQLWWALSSR